MTSDFTAEFLRSILIYDSEMGTWFWRYREVDSGGFNKKFGGKKAGCLHNGYLTIKICGTNYETHRLSVLYMTGEWPPGAVDHINGDRADGRYANLRPATRAENAWNMKLRSDNSTGVKGIHFHRETGKYMARVGYRGERRYLGLFDTLEDAQTARASVIAKLHGEFARAA